MQKSEKTNQYEAGNVSPGEALGQSESFLQFQEQLSKVAKVERPVLLIGERGTGKELAARRLHYLSSRWSGPCITLNCAALSPSLIESELFGYEKGAFTGADRRRTGRFEAADGGTFFLDEIGSIPLETQEKILRVVEYNVFERVGSSSPVEVDVRIIGATNADLPSMAERGEFKRDLLDRLSFEVLFLPPLRAREEDIMLLARHFAGRMAYEIGQEQVPEFSKEAVRALEEYEWPGNIRELKNVVERAVYSTESCCIDHIVFDPFNSPYSRYDHHLAPENDTPPQRPETATTAEPALHNLPFREAVRTFEVTLLERALRQARYNQKKTAEILGLSYDQLRGLLRKHGTSADGTKPPNAP